MNKHLKEGEYLVKDNKISIKSAEKIKSKKSLEYQLSTIIKQEPNSGLFLTRLWYYYRTNDPGDTSKIDSWIKRKIAETPVIYNEDITKQTAKSMEYYLQNQGYFDATTSFQTDTLKKKKRTIVSYTADPKKRYTIDSVSYYCKDIKMQRILNDLQEESFLKRGEPVSSELYSKEVERIISQFRNMGYAYFDRSYIDALSGDSSNHKININLEVFLPRNKSEHSIYHIGKIYVNPNYTPNRLSISQKDTLINGIYFRQPEKEKMIIKPQNISRAIYLTPGDVYQDNNYTRSNQQLGRLEIYKFISLRYFPDSTDQSLLNVEIRLTPRPKMVAGADLEINNSNYSNTSTGTSLLGISANINFKNRNLFRNASVFSTSLQGGIEIDIGNSTSPLYSLDLLAKGEWFIPKFMEFPKTSRGLNRLGVLNNKFYTALKEKGKTKISASYNRLLLFDFYSYHSFNGTFGYDLQSNPRTRISVNQTGINYLLPKTEPAFDTIPNPLLKNSFSEQLFTGFIFRDLSFSKTTRTNLYGKTWLFSGDAEISGAEVWLVNASYNAISGENRTFKLFNKVDYAQYFRLTGDIRRYNQISSKQSLAFRFSSSIALPFGFSEEVPYVKQYAGGGPNGIRAWSIRELGPGSYVDPLTISNEDNIPFYQSGDFKLEFNAEYRFDIFSFFKGAFFLDGGNVWTLREDATRLGSQLLWKSKTDPITGETYGGNFLRQIALGTGFGVRGDFSYFIIRLDMGFKVRNPYADETGRYWLLHTWDKLQLKDITYNLGIGYPF